MDLLNICSFNPRKFIREWISQISHENNTLLNRLQLEFECLEEDDSENRESFCSGHLDDVEEIAITNEKVDDDDFPAEAVEGEIHYVNGNVFHGVFTQDFATMKGKMFESTISDIGVEGTWINGQLEGLIKTDNEYGGYELAFFKRGMRHGVSAEFGPIRSKNFMKCCFYQNGQPDGLCFKSTIGGGFIIGKVYDNKISDNHAAILMPDCKGALTGVVLEDNFVRGKEVEVVSIRLERGMPVPQLSQPKSSIIYRRDVSTSKVISKWPLLKDPWEHRRVEARMSRVIGAGEGLFAKRDLDEGELVALYNGTRSMPSLLEDWSDYRVHFNTEIDIDIPEDKRTTSEYCATLSHKANHSFEPNCRWSRIDHPRFGFICSITAIRKIYEGEEVTVNYRLPLHLAPLWYVQCYEEYKSQRRTCSSSKTIAKELLKELIDDILSDDEDGNHGSKYDEKRCKKEEDIEDRRQFEEQRMI